MRDDESSKEFIKGNFPPGTMVRNMDDPRSLGTVVSDTDAKSNVKVLWSTRYDTYVVVCGYVRRALAESLKVPITT